MYLRNKYMHNALHDRVFLSCLITSEEFRPPILTICLCTAYMLLTHVVIYTYIKEDLKQGSSVSIDHYEHVSVGIKMLQNTNGVSYFTCVRKKQNSMHVLGRYVYMFVCVVY